MLSENVKTDLENSLLSVTLNPLLKVFISRFDIECPQDGNLIVNSLRYFLGEPVKLCPTCTHISRNITAPIYDMGAKLMRSSRTFMQTQFQNQKYGEAWLRGFALVMKGLEKFGVRVPFVPAGPIEIVWNCTYQCNLNCNHCYENAGDEHPQELTTNEAKQVLDKLSKIAGIGLPAISLSGGEPLFRKDFFELAAYAKRSIGYVSLASNGTLITKEIAQRIKDTGIDYVEISIDGATPEVHNAFRGIPNAFQQSMAGVKNCIEAGIDTCIATVVHKNNFNQLRQLVKLANELDTRFMHFNYIPTGRAKEHVQLDLTPEERLDVLQVLGKEIVDLYVKKKDEELRTGHSDLRVDRFFSTCPQYASVTRALSSEKGEKYLVAAHYGAKQGVETVANFLGGCGCGRLYSCIEPNGDFKPCVFFPTNKDTITGNILRDAFEQMWDHNPLLKHLRNRENLQDCMVDGKRVGCSTCADKYICGGCRARSYGYFDGNVDMPDIGCIHNKAIWTNITNHNP
jgi:MoaA/NifB/PqqE/SkfB family radical SAM enzyme